MPYITMPKNMTEEQKLWKDAYLIAWIGACNQTGVQHTLTVREAQFGDHPAVRAIRGHLEFLRGDGLGPEMDDLNEVRAEGEKLLGLACPCGSC